MARIIGDDAHLRRLRKMSAGMLTPVTQAVFAAAQDLAVDASLSITDGATSGANHVPSAPGEPPNADTGRLHGNIEATSTGPLKAEASSNMPYSAALEFGTSSIAERPFMRPAAARARPKAEKRIVDAVNKVLRASGT